MELRSYYETLRATTLLRGMTDEALDRLLAQLAPRLQRCPKGGFLLLAGYPAPDMGIVLEGRLTAYKTTPDGDTVTVTQMGPGGLFGDVLATAGAKSPVTLQAERDCLVLYLPWARLLRAAPDDADHVRLLQNLVATISSKYLALDRRLEIIIHKSLRTRICLWLLEQAAAAGSDAFAVPLTRAALAAYLNCDRSALSRELGRMQREGLIAVQRGRFAILDRAKLQKM